MPCEKMVPKEAALRLLLPVHVKSDLFVALRNGDIPFGGCDDHILSGTRQAEVF